MRTTTPKLNTTYTLNLRGPSPFFARRRLIFGYLVRDAPGVQPLHVFVVLVATRHTPADGDEVDVESDDNSVKDSIDRVLDCLLLVP